MQTLVDDIGSFPLPKGISKETFSKAYVLAREAATSGKNLEKDDFLQKNFCQIVLDSFKKKAACGLDVINYPQHYDGIKQVGDVIHTTMEKGTFIVEQDKAVLPEVYLINQKAKELSQEIGKKIQLRISLFGPLEQYLQEIGKTAFPDVLDSFAETIRRFAKNCILNNKYVQTSVVSIDEPSFGFYNVNAPPEMISKVLEKAFDFGGVTRQIHLHSAACVGDLLNVKNLDVLSFEFAASPGNIEAVPKSMLEKADKQIRVGVSRTDIDSLLAELNEKGISKPSAEQMAESEETIHKRFLAAKEKYGDRMTFTGPDCGLSGWPSQEAAQLLLQRTVKAVKSTKA